MSSYRKAVASSFIVDDEIKEYIKKQNRDFRLCTSCGGPILVPVDMAPPKPTDIEIVIDENTLYISAVQARFTRRIHRSLLEQWTLDLGSGCNVD